MYLYNNILNILWVHFYNSELNIMSIKYPKTFKKQCNYYFHYSMDSKRDLK